MTVPSANPPVPGLLVTPEEAKWAPALTARLEAIARAAWRQLEALGQARAERELRRLAVHYAHDPVFAQQLREAVQRADSPY